MGFFIKKINIILIFCLFFVFILIIIMALTSPDFKNPDEHFHLMAVKYYYQHWLPPRIGEPSARDTYENGISRLNNPGVEYFITGKLSLIFNKITKNELLSARLFPVMLFLILVIICFIRYSREPEHLIVFSVLLITPQIWCIFSYINDDVFPLFLSLITVSEITYKRGSFYRFLTAEPVCGFIQGGILFGFLLGLISISKLNYLCFILIVIFYFFISSVEVKKINGVVRKNIFINLFSNLKINREIMIKYGLIILTALFVFLLRYVLDLSINGFNRSAELTVYQEKINEYCFKPSTAKNELKNFYFGSFLRERGVKYSEIFTIWKWHIHTIKSFMGAYGDGSKAYYLLMVLNYFILLIYLFFIIWKNKLFKSAILFAGFIFFIVLMVLISSYLSWVRDFQAQGRYLFPLLGMLSLLLFETKKGYSWLYANFFIFISSLLSIYSFIFIGLLNLKI